MIIKLRRKLGLSLTAREAKVSMATKPPSPSLSARKTNPTYLIETITVKVQKMIDKMPKTLSGVKATCPEPKISFMAYSTLVPISPYTTPIAPSVSAAIDDLEVCKSVLPQLSNYQAS